MARLIIEDAVRTYSWWRIGLIGAALGVVQWGLAALIRQFIVDPLFCGTQFNANMCSNALGLSGDIATVLVAVIGLFVLIRLSVPRPIVVALATAITAWGVSAWTTGMGVSEVISWTAVIYGLGYLAFAWMSRYYSTTIMLVMVVVVIAAARIITRL